ncbi:Rts2p Ecym_4035 [Eremothecium cymbalariae DBVPG|uniref:C2H2-type domain-containing protein n=1 Tax=Eremothecium cymbalariae (strain CBS 270.75 / DBVPG 7215 / KCTC 17166 / NRRL Y-17582) TaxID=931890 RepID=G8JSW4_ERECY|nr:hypothetical protein Ecym_4035 [Eremothecium cymbalariae DBVPG\
MAKAEIGTAKYISKQLKARGLQKLRYYCQVCKKQCRDDNGFQSHIKSPSHLKRIGQVTKEDIEEYTKRFEYDFLKLLKMTHGEKKIEANKFYNEYIQDKDHIHMNATKFTSLTKFIQYLSKKGEIKVHGIGDIDAETQPTHITISFIDKSYDNVLRKEKLLQSERGQKGEEEIKQLLIRKQMEDGSVSDTANDEPKHGIADWNDTPAPENNELTPVKGKFSLVIQKPTKHKVSKKKKCRAVSAFK